MASVPLVPSQMTEPCLPIPLENMDICVGSGEADANAVKWEYEDFVQDAPLFTGDVPEDVSSVGNLVSPVDEVLPEVVIQIQRD